MRAIGLVRSFTGMSCSDTEPVFQIERLGNVIVHARFKTAFFGFFHGTGREGDDGRVAIGISLDKLIGQHADQ